MERIEKKFHELKQKNEKALVAYLTAGDPDLPTTEALIKALAATGVDILEIEVPFSDPTADGPIIQAASRRALHNGATLAKILDMIKIIRKTSEIPIVLFGYYNPVFIYGNEAFALRAQAVGVDGILVVDLPPEEAAELRMHTDQAGIDFISLIAPTTPDQRIRRIAEKAGGFLYYISVTGVTGTAKPIVENIRRDLTKIRKISKIPPPSIWAKFFGWGFSGAIIALFIAGFFYSGGQASINMMLSWSTITATCAAIGAILLLAHPLTILASALSAPIATLHPLIATGWVAGLVEASFRKPQVKDFLALKDDITTVRGFFRNKITRLLILVAFVNLTTSIGTFVAIPVMMKYFF